MKNPSIKNFSLQEIYNNKKTKNENTMIPFMREIAHVDLCVCLHVHMQLHASKRTVWIKYFSVSLT